MASQAQALAEEPGAVRPSLVSLRSTEFWHLTPPTPTSMATATPPTTALPTNSVTSPRRPTGGETNLTAIVWLGCLRVAWADRGRGFPQPILLSITLLETTFSWSSIWE